MKKIALFSVISLALISASFVYAGTVVSGISSISSTGSGVASTTISRPEIVCDAPANYLKYGDGMKNGKSDDVIKLQQHLLSKGYITVSPTGYFGPLTLQAVKKLQRDEGLPAFGYVGALTISKIKNSCGPSPVCDYANPPAGCTYVAGPNYNTTTGCGLILSCNNDTTYTPPANCSAWNDGCNVCSRQTPDGPAMCTKRACIGAYMMQAKCNAYFDTTSTCTALGKTYTEGQATGCIDSNGQTACIADASYVCRSGQWKIEGGYPIPKPPVACTMEARLCPNGSMVPRDANCTWHPEQCPLN